MNTHLWIQHFHSNRDRFTEPELPPRGCMLPADVLRALRESLAVFQLGESGGGTRLMQYVRHAARPDQLPGYEEAVSLFVAEEQYHERLLERVVLYMGGSCLERQWSNSVFRWLRNHFGVEFNIQILLTAELIAEVYFGTVYRRCGDVSLRRICHKLLSDEMRHVAFNGDFLRERLADQPPWWRLVWRAQFSLIHGVTAMVVAWDHRHCLRALGVPPHVFVMQARKTGTRFLRRLEKPLGLWQPRLSAENVTT